MIENVIAEAVPNSGCFEVPKMQFWKKLKIVRTLAPSDGGPYSAGYKVLWRCIEKLTNLRNAAAHKDYEILRDERFTDLAEFFYPDAAFRTARSRELLLQESTEICAGMLMGMRHNFERHRQGSQDAKGAPERTNQ